MESPSTNPCPVRSRITVSVLTISNILCAFFTFLTYIPYYYWGFSTHLYTKENYGKPPESFSSCPGFLEGWIYITSIYVNPGMILALCLLTVGLLISARKRMRVIIAIEIIIIVFWLLLGWDIPDKINSALD